MEIIITKLKCKRCGYSWYPHSEKIPKVCPHCHNPYWNEDRIRGVRFTETKIKEK